MVMGNRPVIASAAGISQERVHSILMEDLDISPLGTQTCDS